MKKAIIALMTLSLACCTFGCNKEQKIKEAREASAAEAVQTESIRQIEAKYQLNDPSAADPSTALLCKYVVISNGNRMEATTRTSGQCDFNSLAGSLASAGSVSDGVMVGIMDRLASLKGVPNSAAPSMNCVVYNVTTSLRTMGLQDCTISGKPAAGFIGEAAADITKALGL